MKVNALLEHVFVQQSFVNSFLCLLVFLLEINRLNVYHIECNASDLPKDGLAVQEIVKFNTTNARNEIQVFESKYLKQILPKLQISFSIKLALKKAVHKLILSYVYLIFISLVSWLNFKTETFRRCFLLNNCIDIHTVEDVRKFYRFDLLTHCAIVTVLPLRTQRA